MSIIDAWEQLFRLSSGNNWVKIPDKIRQVLGLDSRLGICGGILCTQSAANSVNRFVDKLNAIGESK